MEPTYKFVQVRLDASFYQRVRVALALTGETAQDVLLRALREYVAEHGRMPAEMFDHGTEPATSGASA